MSPSLSHAEQAMLQRACEAPVIRQGARRLRVRRGTSRAWPVIPSGVLPLNILGIGEQAPAAFECVGDGPYHTLEVSGTKVYFRHSADKGAARMLPTTLLVVQALKALGLRERSEACFIRAHSRSKGAQ